MEAVILVSTSLITSPLEGEVERVAFGRGVAAGSVVVAYPLPDPPPHVQTGDMVDRCSETS
jgi:hypothetical protein